MLAPGKAQKEISKQQIEPETPSIRCVVKRDKNSSSNFLFSTLSCGDLAKRGIRNPIHCSNDRIELCS